MHELFRRIRAHFLLNSVLTLILGIILTLSPGMAARTMVLMIGWVLVIAGVVALMASLFVRSKPLGQGDLVLGLLQLATGLVLLAKPDMLVSLCGIVLGLLLVVHGAGDIQTAREAKALGYDWKLTIVVGVLKLLMAVLVILAPFSTAELVIRVAGICLILDGVGDLLLLWRSK